MKFSFELIKNKDLSAKNLNNIVTLKSEHWKYNFEEQVKWIRENIKENDYHLLLIDNASSLIGYMNLVEIVVKSDLGEETKLGIGNVCISENVQGKGYGILLMQIAIFILNNLGNSGVLLCKPALNHFYQNAGWFLYNGITEINGASFEASVFTNKFLSSSNLYIEKYF
jgi:predicted GNAT family N-acyltransferase